MRNISQLWSQRDRITEERSDRRDNDDFEDGGRGHEPRDVGTSRSWKGKEMTSLLKLPEGTQLY